MLKPDAERKQLTFLETSVDLLGKVYNEVMRLVLIAFAAMVGSALYDRWFKYVLTVCGL